MTALLSVGVYQRLAEGSDRHAGRLADAAAARGVDRSDDHR
jgi:hypothetical protein